MIEHFIILYSDYKSGKRIALHKSDEKIDGIAECVKTLETLKAEFEHLTFGFHHLQTSEHSWDSIVNYDKFFSDVTPITNFKDFKEMISDDLMISAFDIANLLTSRMQLTHLKLQKLIYLFYCKFVKKYDYRPFDEEFYAWQYGPVIKELYEKYKIYGRDEIEQEDNDYLILKDKPFKLSVFSKFTKTPIDYKIVETLEETIKEYGEYSAFSLVDLTHVEDGPWDIIYKNGLGRDEVIPHNLIHQSCSD
ncbi:Panacea domain-containing protein [Cytobacillus kochii]|uniref:Panacea domain-containing protein n=1 Tax=Cytobacillus kochii TaxID=859143 RepID=UPI00203C0AA4|nr:type II toxin-antitoxin system antitoxin SocA domain-containing protein [Cytobacillus kochii]MCM3324225.1 DUF4065 domain-containing protein [Cytobacillus kochii]MCM3346706.1 DUF4065 domain-containing protein [Cytobacillus kochii]